MSKLVFNQALGLSSPIAFKFNPLAAIGTAIAGIGTLGNIFGQASANAGNERIARENREWQSEENRLSEQWQEKMWNANNVYNTPSAMKHRMLEAGINPFISSGGIGANSSQLASAPARQSAPNFAPMQRLDFGNVSQSVMQAAGVSANINVANQEAISKALDNAFNLGKKFNDWNAAKQFLEQNLRMISGSSFDPAKSPEMQMFNQMILGQQATASLQSFNAKMAEKYGEKTITNMQANQEMQFNHMAAEIGKMASDVKVNDKQIDRMVSEMARNYAEANNLKADTETINAIRQEIVNQMSFSNSILEDNKETSRAWFNANNEVRDYWQSPQGRKDLRMTESGGKNWVINRVERATGITSQWMPNVYLPMNTRTTVSY